MESSETILHSRNSDRTLVIMAKAPRPGMVKTRLAQSLPRKPSLSSIAAFWTTPWLWRIPCAA